ASKINLAALVLMIASQGSAGPMILTNLAQVAVTNSYGRDLEREADKEGFRILLEAGFPPAAMVTSLEAMIYDQLKRPYVDPGVFMTHPELSERVAYILQTAREKNVPIRRKKALNLLRPSVESREGKTVLLLDGDPVWSLPESGESRAAAVNAAEKIDDLLQMETAPYEIQIISLDGKNALRVGPSIIAREPLPKGAGTLESFRESLVQSLGEARNKHPGAKYLH
nr:M48 family metalloprotease [Aminivibrio sp.]